MLDRQKLGKLFILSLRVEAGAKATRTGRGLPSGRSSRPRATVFADWRYPPGIELRFTLHEPLSGNRTFTFR